MKSFFTVLLITVFSSANASFIELKGGQEITLVSNQEVTVSCDSSSSSSPSLISSKCHCKSFSHTNGFGTYKIIMKLVYSNATTKDLTMHTSYYSNMEECQEDIANYCN
jgi:hypothetical protein